MNQVRDVLQNLRFRKKPVRTLPDRHLLEANRNLRELLEDTSIPAKVRLELESEFNEIEEMLTKLRREEIHIAVFGRVGAGKSSLLNALIDKDIFETSPLHGMTRDAKRANWSAISQDHVQLIDTPGIDELDGLEREALANDLAKRADILIMVCEADLTEKEFLALESLVARKRPLILVLNKADRYSREELELLLRRLRQRCTDLLPPERILTASADPRPEIVIIQSADGHERESSRPRTADVYQLRTLLWTVLEREGKTLAALNAALFASELDSQIADRIVAARQAVAERVIRNYCITKGLAVAVNPVPVADLLAAAGIDVALVIHLGDIYGFSLSRREATRLLFTIATQLAALMGAYWGINLVSSALKTVSAGLSTALTATAQGALAWYATYLTGTVAASWFAHGKSWGDAGPKETVREILASLDQDSILLTAREEIATLIDRPARKASTFS
ncbi:MAG: GTP-binding protein Era [Lysobacterales bacterium]